MQFVTDSLFHKTKFPDAIWLRDGIFNWRVVLGSDGMEIQKAVKKEAKTLFDGPFSDHEIVGIVSRSDYRLIHDLFETGKEVRLYLPEKSVSGFGGKYIPDRMDVEREFLRYMKRSYLSYLSYQQLNHLGLRRIEQVMAILMIERNRKIKKYDGIFFLKNETVKDVGKIKKVKVGGVVDPVMFCLAVAEETGVGFMDIFNELMKLYSRIGCSDPFGNRLEVYEDGELKRLWERAVKIIFGGEKIVEFESGRRQRIRWSDVADPFFRRCHGLQEENYFPGKVIYEGENRNIEAVIRGMERLMPRRDALLTLQLLYRMKKAEEHGFLLETSLSGRISYRKNREWIDMAKWQQIYEKEDWHMGGILRELEVEKSLFVCPKCGNTHYVVSPERVYCSRSPLCNFSISRVNLQKIGVPRVPVQSIIEALSTGGTMVKNKEGKQVAAILKEFDEGRKALWVNLR